MAYRNLMIASNAQLKIKNEQLLITTNTTHSIPIEDINSVLIENHQSTITIAALAKLVQNGVAIFVCDEKHTPCAIMMPFAQNSRQYGVTKLQESLSLPLQKQLWQQIVKCKINNQAICLELNKQDSAAQHLRSLIKKVNSGDSNNTEAFAAAAYFKALFGSNFVRNNDNDPLNAALNYGYAIIRGHIARLIASYGFLPMKGIHHKSELNAYNLADDFIEPFRPLVDLYVAQEAQTIEVLTPQLKKMLYNLLNMDIKIAQQHHSVTYAAEKMIQSFSRCCQKTTKELLLPTLVALRQHKYE